MLNTYLVLLDPELGFGAIDGPDYEFDFDLSEATFIHCTTLEDIEYVQSLDVSTVSMSSDAVAALPFVAQVVEAKDITVYVLPCAWR